MKKPLPLETSADTATLWAAPAWWGLDRKMTVANTSIDRHRFGKTAGRRALSYQVRVYFLRGPMGLSGRTTRPLFLRDDTIRRVIV